MSCRTKCSCCRRCSFKANRERTPQATCRSPAHMQTHHELCHTHTHVPQHSRSKGRAADHSSASNPGMNRSVLPSCRCFTSPGNSCHACVATTQTAVTLTHAHTRADTTARTGLQLCTPAATRHSPKRPFRHSYSGHSTHAHTQTHSTHSAHTHKKPSGPEP